MNRIFSTAIAAIVVSFSARADLASYLARPEPANKWEQRSVTTTPLGTLQDLSLVSQVWQGNTWKHDIQVFRAAKAAHPEFCLLLNTGGSENPGDAAVGVALAKETGCTVAVLYGIPNQPLYGKSEDALIVYSWQKFVETGDETWPLQFPMVKSVVKAMDAVQASAKDAKAPAVKAFLITGASKRGWTTWLTAASGDKRVKAIAPMVIDILNMPAQMPHQVAMYGKPSDEIHDYSAGGMLDTINTAPGKRIVAMTDPYSYRSKLTLPKLILLGTNDPYWSQDALNLYWDGLVGPKWVMYDPNSGHGLEDRSRLLATLSSFTRCVAGGEKWPHPTWKWTGDGTGATITISSDSPFKSARLFRVESATTDFRKSKWSSTEITDVKNPMTVHAPNPATGYAASFVELTYEQDGKPFTLSTQLRILGAGK